MQLTLSLLCVPLGASLAGPPHPETAKNNQLRKPGGVLLIKSLGLQSSIFFFKGTGRRLGPNQTYKGNPMVQMAAIFTSSSDQQNKDCSCKLHFLFLMVKRRQDEIATNEL